MSYEFNLTLDRLCNFNFRENNFLSNEPVSGCANEFAKENFTAHFYG